MQHFAFAGLTGVATTLGFMELSKDSTVYTKNKQHDRIMKSAKDDAFLFIATDGKQGNTAQAAMALRARRGQLSDRQVAE